MDPALQGTGNTSPTIIFAGSQTPNKHPLPSRELPPSKKARQAIEVPAIYSDAVRKKLASTTRTGQACDRCKERKMKCDTDPIACQPCRQKNLRCFTTDRVTGNSRERGQTDRAENELHTLRERNAAYQKKYGRLELKDFTDALDSPMQESDIVRVPIQQVLPESDSRTIELNHNAPDTEYAGWPASVNKETVYSGPMNGTRVDVLDGVIDIGDFPCEMMDEYSIYNLNVFNMSKTSAMNTLTGYQTITDPRLPSKEQALQDANTFILILAQYVPILHPASFLQTINRIYDQPDTASQSERVQLVAVLATVEQQMGVRNHRESAERYKHSHCHIHYALTYYRELLREGTLASMQALALILVYFRNLPKPGYTWGFSHDVLIKAIEMDYHRDPDKIILPPSERNPLAKELRKRVFHSILGICVTTGFRAGRPAPLHFDRMDVPLPMAIKDSEITADGCTTPLSGSCDFWPCLQLARLLPLLMDVYNHVTSVRREEKEYLRSVGILHNKIDAWRRDWDDSIRHEPKSVGLNVATLLVDGWAAEFILNLYHPSLCPSRSSEVMERHLDICHKQTQRLLRNFHMLSSKYRGADFTWHSTAAYALAFGLALHIFKQRIPHTSEAQFDSIHNEMKGWMSLMAYADLVLRTGNHLQHLFEPRVKQIEIEYQNWTKGKSIELLHPSQNLAGRSGIGQPTHKSGLSPKLLAVKALPKGSSDVSVQIPSEPTAIQYGQAHYVRDGQQWPPTSQYSTMSNSINHSLLPHNGNITPTYSAYTTNPPPHPSLPTSLAPLLNDYSHVYVTYSSPVPATQNELMHFRPTHYTDAPEAMMWPMINFSQQ